MDNIVTRLAFLLSATIWILEQFCMSHDKKETAENLLFGGLDEVWQVNHTHEFTFDCRHIKVPE